jgi:hypothetical protein
LPRTASRLWAGRDDLDLGARRRADPSEEWPGKARFVLADQIVGIGDDDVGEQGAVAAADLDLARAADTLRPQRSAVTRQHQHVLAQRIDRKRLDPEHERASAEGTTMGSGTLGPVLVGAAP